MTHSPGNLLSWRCQKCSHAFPLSLCRWHCWFQERHRARGGLRWQFPHSQRPLVGLRTCTLREVTGSRKGDSACVHAVPQPVEHVRCWERLRATIVQCVLHQQAHNSLSVTNSPTPTRCQQVGACWHSAKQISPVRCCSPSDRVCPVILHGAAHASSRLYSARLQRNHSCRPLPLFLMSHTLLLLLLFVLLLLQQILTRVSIFSRQSRSTSQHHQHSPTTTMKRRLVHPQRSKS
jgi:hypothetical protein